MPNDEILPHARALSEETARRLIDTLDRRGAWTPVRRIRSSQIATAVLGSIGAALLFVGVENAAQDIPVRVERLGLDLRRSRAPRRNRHAARAARGSRNLIASPLPCANVRQVATIPSSQRHASRSCSQVILQCRISETGAPRYTVSPVRRLTRGRSTAFRFTKYRGLHRCRT